MKTCSIDDCNRKLYAKGYCQKHYDAYKRHGDPLVSIRNKRKENMSDKEVLQFIRDNITINSETECHEWNRHRYHQGYGQIFYDGRQQYVHRVIYQIINKIKLLPSDEIMHSCDNPCCCNINHLSLGDKNKNMADMVAKGRQQHGENHYKTSLLDTQIEEIRDLFNEGLKNTEIAKRFNVSRQVISDIRRGRTRNAS